MDSPIPFSPARVDRLRRRVQKACPVCGDAPEGWSRADADFGPLLAAFPPLALRDGMALCGYRFMAGANGNGLVWAIPQGTAIPEPADCVTSHDGHFPRPRPPAAVPVPAALSGDRSPWSYLCASILVRELGEYGAVWHGCWWGVHVLLSTDPWAAVSGPGARTARAVGGDGVRNGAGNGNVALNAGPAGRRRPRRALAPSIPVGWPSGGREAWRWLDTPPDDWRPSFRNSDGRPVISFYTFSGLGGETIYHHEDTYEPGSYVFRSSLRSVAEGGPGFVF